MALVAELSHRRDTLLRTVRADQRREDGAELGPAALIRQQYRIDAAVAGRAVAATRFAQHVLQPGRAVIIDTETVSMKGPICEIAVIDAHTGQPLLDTLINPGLPITQAAYAVHGITDQAVTGPHVPTWAEVYHQFKQVTHATVMLAYNAEYDRRVIAADCRRYGVDDTGTSTHAQRWADVMAPRSDYADATHCLRNGGTHRALGDVQQTRLHLLAMANGALNDRNPVCTTQAVRR
jgi:DNA polymerase-3 subunit epsilon